jgi:hypothetical protein
MAMAEVVQLETGKPKDETEQQREIISILERMLGDARDGQIQSVIIYVGRTDSFHQSFLVWEDALKTLGMVEMLKSDIVRAIYKMNDET